MWETATGPADPQVPRSLPRPAHGPDLGRRKPAATGCPTHGALLTTGSRLAVTPVAALEHEAHCETHREHRRTVRDDAHEETEERYAIGGHSTATLSVVVVRIGSRVSAREPFCVMVASGGTGHSRNIDRSQPLRASRSFPEGSSLAEFRSIEVPRECFLPRRAADPTGPRGDLRARGRNAWARATRRG